jgi:hypothetical protein
VASGSCRIYKRRQLFPWTVCWMTLRLGQRSLCHQLHLHRLRPGEGGLCLLEAPGMAHHGSCVAFIETQVIVETRSVCPSLLPPTLPHIHTRTTATRTSSSTGAPAARGGKDKGAAGTAGAPGDPAGPRGKRELPQDPKKFFEGLLSKPRAAPAAAPAPAPTEPPS